MSEMTDHMLKAIREYVKLRTVPIIVPVAETIDQVGTGTFLRVGDRLFLITAKHVVDDYSADKLAVPSNPIRDPDPRTLGKIKVTSAKQDFVDVAVIELLEDDAIPRVSKGWGLITLDDVALASEDGEFALCGYPSRAGIRPKQHLIGSTLLAFNTYRLESDPPDADRPVHKDLDLFFRYDVKAESDGGVIDTPHLGGCSGCSIWEWHEVPEHEVWSADKAFKVVAVQSRMAKDFSYFRAKSWTYVHQLLREHDSSLNV